MSRGDGLRARVGTVLLGAVIAVESVACGGDDAGPPGGTPSDANPASDARTGDTDAGSDQVTVVVAISGAASAGVPVVFHRADGSVLGEDATDGDGTAHGSMEPGGMVSVVGTSIEFEEHVDAFALLTITGVEPGETIEVKSLAPSAEAVVGLLHVSFAEPPPAGVTQRLTLGCNDYGVAIEDFSQPTTVSLYSDCIDADGRVSVLATSHRPDGLPVAYSQLVNVELDVDGETDIAMPTPWGTALEQARIDITNSSLTWTAYQLDTALYRHGRAFGLRDLEAADDAALVVRYPAGFGSGFERFVAARGPGACEGCLRSSWLLERIDPIGDPSATIDTADLLSPAVSVAVDDADPARPVIEWELPAEGPTPDGRLLELGGSWYIALPHDATSARFPALPDSLADLRPQSPISYVTVHSLEADFISDYAAYRREFTGFFFFSFSVFERPGPSRALWQ